MTKDENEPYELDWGEIFVESYNSETKNATLIYNLNFETNGLVEDNISYSAAHIFWVFSNLPLGSSITAIYDVRNSNLSQALIDQIEEKIINHISSLTTLLKLTIIFRK
jgi:hypothetical protein